MLPKDFPGADQLKDGDTLTVSVQDDGSIQLVAVTEQGDKDLMQDFDESVGEE